MMHNVNRRDFIKRTSLLPFCVAAAGLEAQVPAKRSILKTSLNAYSFNKMLNDNIKGRGPGITLV